MGKTTEFKQEASISGGSYVTAREFVRMDPSRRPGWSHKTLFIDGLDEIRAGASDPRNPIDDVIEKLAAIGDPRFRISCHTGSWLTYTDRTALKSLQDENHRNHDPILLELNPLTAQDLNRILPELQDCADVDPNSFIQEAIAHRMNAFLWNPHLLQILVKAILAKGWPQNSLRAFESACDHLATEFNKQHIDSMQPRVLAVWRRLQIKKTSIGRRTLDCLDLSY